MIRILHTGDLHIGKKYVSTNYDAKVGARYRKARLDALESIVNLSNVNNCDYLVIAGDLFDSKSVIKDIRKEVFNALARSSATVVIIPGNHDYCTDADDKFWKSNNELAGTNTVILKKYESYSEQDKNVTFFPCYCDKNSSEDSNRLGWIANSTLSPDGLNIGIAHGAIEGLSCDKEHKYYTMKTEELNATGMDLWLIGHTHISYKDIPNRIFNAGTHQQTDISDNSESTVFLIDIDDDKKLTITEECTGVIKFVRREININHGDSLKDTLEKELTGNIKDTSYRFILSGIVSEDDYNSRNDIYKEVGKEAIFFEVFDDSLSPEITKSRIDQETLPDSIENKLLTSYLKSNRPELLNLAFELICSCKGGNA